MEKRQLLKFLTVIALLVLFASPVSAQQAKPKHAPNLLPGVQPEMHTPEYWIALQKDADDVIMTPAEIQIFNEKVRTKKVTFRDYYGKPDPLERQFVLTETKGPVMNPLLPLELADSLPGDSLRVRLASNREWLYSRDFYNERYDPYHEGMKQDVVDDMNSRAIPDTITRRFGIIVKHANVRHYPTAIPGYGAPGSKADLFQATALLIGNPVAVIHESQDGDFLYIESPISRGWVKAETVAFADRETLRSFIGSKDFLMATGNKIPVYSDPEFRNFSRYLYFSATMPLIARNENGYTVRMACRGADSTLEIIKGYIKPEADVHAGYLPYTKRNVLIQIFKLLNEPYGWADQYDKRDCSGTMRVLLRCFGIITGRHPSFILSSSNHQVFIDPNLSAGEKIAEVSKIEPVITMAGNYGHIVLFLGKARNGKLYFMHQGGWGYKDEGGDGLIVGRVSINPVDHVWYDIHKPNVYTTIRF